MAYEDLESGGSIYQGGGQSSYTPSSVHFNPGGESAFLTAQFNNTNMSETLRSFKDSMAFSFQTLNLTLSSLTNTLGTLTTKMGNANTSLFASNIRPESPFSAAPTNYMQRGYDRGVYPGSIPNNYLALSMAGRTSNISLLRDAVPGNIGPTQFYYNREREMPYSVSNSLINYGVNGTIGAMDLAGQLYMGSMFGGGFLGGIGGALIGGIPAMVAGAIARPFAEDAIVHNKDVYNVQNMSTRFGDRFTTRQAQRFVKNMDNMAYRELMTNSAQDVSIGMQGYRDITMMGLQSNLFSGSSPEELSKQVSSAAQVVKFLAGVMGNVDVQEAMKTLKQLKDMGVNVATDPAMARRFGSAAFKYGAVTGIQPDQLMSTAANMAVGSYGAYRNPAFVGIESGMRNMAYLRELEKRKMLTPAEIAAAGGLEAMGTRQMGFQAGLLNSGIGTAMLYSAATPGGGFNSKAFERAASKGNFFDMVTQAGSNFYSRGPLGMIDFMVNKADMIANAGKDGKIDERLDTVMLNMIKLNPAFRMAKTGRDQINAAAFYIHEYAPMLGVDMTFEDAKAMATRIVHKSVGINLDNKADREINMAQNAKTRASYTVGAQFSRIGTGIDRIKGTIFENIARKTRGWADELTASVAEKAGTDSYLYTGDTISSDTFGMYSTGANLAKRASGLLGNGLEKPSEELGGMFNRYDFGRVIDAVNYNDAAGAGISPLQAFKGSTFISGNLESVASMLAGNTVAAYKDIATLALDEKTGNASGLFSNSGLFSYEADYNKFKDTVTDTPYFGTVRPQDLAIKVADYALKDGGRGDLIRARANDIGTLSADARKGFIKALQDSSGRKLTVNMQDRIIDMTANQAMYTSGLNKNDPMYKLALKTANDNEYNGTDQQKVARIFSEMFGYEGSDNSLATMYAGADIKDINSANVAAFKLMPDVAGGVNKELSMQNINTSSLGVELAGITGVDAKFVNTMSDMYGAGKTGSEVEALADYVSELGKTGKASKASLNKFKTNKMQALATGIDRDKVLNWALNAKDEKGRELFQRKSSMINGYETYENDLTAESWDKVAAYIKANGANIMMSNAQDGLVKSVEALGLKMDSKEAMSMLSTTTGEGFKKLEEKINSQGTKWAKDQLKYVKNMSNDQLSNLIGSKVTDQERSGAMVTAMRYVAGAEGQKQQAQNQANKNKVESLIDTAVDTTSGVPYVRVIQVNDEVKEARRKQEEAAKNAKNATEMATAKMQEEDYKRTHFVHEDN